MFLKILFLSLFIAIEAKKLFLIVPGTKWCGPGHSATSIDDLGVFTEADKCCRAHDLCPQAILENSSRFGLKNSGYFAKSHCDCDKRFYECLKKSRNGIADEIGMVYFSMSGLQCFKLDYPVIGCLERNRERCVRYQFDENGEKKYQWFDNLYY